MNVHRLIRAAVLSMLACVSVVLSSSCARSGDGGEAEPVLFAPDSGAVGQSLCVETLCPHPFATCPGNTAPCTVNLRTDVANCGACGAACPQATPSTHGTWVCSEGKCQLACDAFWANCNGKSDDGCEVSTMLDPKNCGFCGNACADGVLCWKGACGCPNGLTQCGNDCVDVTSDDKHCTACNTPCVPPPSADPRWICGPDVTPPNTKFRCGSSSCQLRCNGGFQDCNSDFCGDGCEVDVRTDPLNCGACGNACAPGQVCWAGTCLCPAGMTRCASGCVDLSVDTRNCGACGRRCPGGSEGGGPSCEGGVCKYVCYPGFADCDKNIANGCEANLNTNQNHCGSCGNKCDARAGQPCVLGQCLTKPCENGPVR
jgi:hypothetical protein